MRASPDVRRLAVDADAGVVRGQLGRPIGTLDTSGYRQLDLRPYGLGLVMAHRFIWQHVHGPIPAGFEINHINGIKIDNRIVNLELVTHAENIRHAYRTGLKSNAGEHHPSHRLTENAVREIRRAHGAGVTNAVLAERFDVHRRTINDIVLHHTWVEVA